MDTVLSTTLLLMLACSIVHVLRSLQARMRRKSNYNLPPGPSLLTIIRNSKQLYKKPQQTMAKLAKTYGPIMRFTIGQSTTIVISSIEATQEVLQTHDSLFSDRTNPLNSPMEPSLCSWPSISYQCEHLPAYGININIHSSSFSSLVLPIFLSLFSS